MHVRRLEWDTLRVQEGPSDRSHQAVRSGRNARAFESEIVMRRPQSPGSRTDAGKACHATVLETAIGRDVPDATHRRVRTKRQPKTPSRTKTSGKRHAPTQGGRKKARRTGPLPQTPGTKRKPPREREGFPRNARHVARRKKLHLALHDLGLAHFPGSRFHQVGLCLHGGGVVLGGLHAARAR